MFSLALTLHIQVAVMQIQTIETQHLLMLLRPYHHGGTYRRPERLLILCWQHPLRRRI
jgi:hypothetical protein